MARKSKEEAEKTRVRILASALSLFAEVGYENATFDAIARRLGLTKGAVYYHFDSKEALLVALVKLALEKFRRQVAREMPKGELTFPAVAAMLVKNATLITGDPQGCDFFRLIHGQIRWGDASMESVREQLLMDVKSGPRELVLEALRNDIAAGRVRRSVDPVAVSSAVIALWDGLVKARLDRFLDCDLAKTLENFYRGLWMGIAAKGGFKTKEKTKNGK